MEDITPHESTPYERPPAQQIIISGMDELHGLMLELISAHEPVTEIQYHGADGGGDIQASVLQMSKDIMRTDPVAAFAVNDISIEATRIVAYYDITIEIDFKKTREQIEAIISASTQRYMITELIEIMSLYKDEAVFLTNLQLEKEEIIERITELYYSNPRRIVMMPYITVEIFPQIYSLPQDDMPQPGAGGEIYRIYEIKFGYTEETEMLLEVGENLDSSVRQNAARADGETDGEIILSLLQNLIAGAVYDEAAARTISMHGPQNIAATAYGALVRGSAVGEGFAMAFKALCDELRLECRVVLGYIGGDRYHAWNIVMLDGYYYHIDAAMCALNGPEAGFLKSDSDFALLDYAWDTDNTPHCNGPLTLEDLLPPEEEPTDPDDTDDTGNADDPDNPGNSGNTDDTNPDDPAHPGDDGTEPAEPENNGETDNNGDNEGN